MGGGTIYIYRYIYIYTRVCLCVFVFVCVCVRARVFQALFPRVLDTFQKSAGLLCQIAASVSAEQIKGPRPKTT